MRDGRNKVMRRALNRSMKAIKSLGTIECRNDLDFAQGQFLLLQESEIPNVS